MLLRITTNGLMGSMDSIILDNLFHSSSLNCQRIICLRFVMFICDTLVHVIYNDILTFDLSSNIAWILFVDDSVSCIISI